MCICVTDYHCLFELQILYEIELFAFIVTIISMCVVLL
jgi:hypothetical protein